MIGGSILYLVKTMRNCCTLSQPSGFCIYFTRNAPQRFMLSAATSMVRLERLRLRGTWLSAFRFNSLTTYIQFRKTVHREDLLLLETKKKKSFWLISRVRNAKSSKTYFMLRHQRIFGGTWMFKLSSPLCWLSKPWVNDGNTLYREERREFDAQWLYVLWI